MYGVALGPQQIPPQGARALIRGLLDSKRIAPEVVATLDELEPHAPVIEVTNIGRATAIDVRFVLGGDPEQGVGNLAPGASERVRVRPVPYGPVRCTWTCRDRHGRSHRWHSG